MAVAYYVCPIIGDGLTVATGFRAKILDMGLRNSAIIPCGADGKPLFTWTLCIVNTPDHSAIIADATIDQLPAVGLDVSIPAGVKATLRTKLQARGMTLGQINAVIGGTLRQLIRFLGQRLHANFDEATFHAG